MACAHAHSAPRAAVLLVLGALSLSACGSSTAGSPAARGSPSTPAAAVPRTAAAGSGAGAGVDPSAGSVDASAGSVEGPAGSVGPPAGSVEGQAASVDAQLFGRPAAEQLRRGTVVAAAHLGVGVFADPRHGFTLASIDYRTYPAATIDGGRTWRIDGPVLPIPAAPAPTAGVQPGVAGPETYFASEGLEGTTVVEVTTDAGKHWWQAFLPGGVVYVGAFDGELTAIIAVASGDPERARVEFWAYHSKSGRRWNFDGVIDSVSS